MEKRLLEAKKQVSKELQKIPNTRRTQIIGAIESLATNPFPSGKKFKPLKGFEDMYRLRVGDYRIIYEVHPEVITILTILHRKDLEGFS